MRFHRLVDYFSRIEATTKRLEMFDILAALFEETGADDIDKAVYLCQGQLLPPFMGVEIGMSTKLLTRAIALAAGARTDAVEALYAETGDLGIVAERLVAGTEKLSVARVYEELSGIAHASGRGSVEAKVNLMASLLRAVSPSEARYVARFVIGRLRLGVGDPTVLEALALSLGDRAMRPELERAYNLCPDLGLVARTLKSSGIGGVRAIGITVGYPVRMALCERLSSAPEIIAKIGRAAVEAKYDGFRCQVHKDGERVEIFSRNLERTTPMFPEIAAAARALPAHTLIIEGEALVHDESTGELQPFQVTIQRKRKHGVADAARDHPLKFFAFELLYLDGLDLTPEPYLERRKRLEALLAGAPTAIEPARMFITEDPEEIRRRFEEFVETGLEGVVAKRLDSPYAAGSRNFNWIKLKRSYKGELADSLDVCVIGYFRGRGARTRLGVGALLGALYDPAGDCFRSVTKIGTGFSEEEFIRLKELLDGIALTHRHPRVDSAMTPDVWVEPRYVVRVMADEITRSPSHTAGRDALGVGYALRFPRAEGFIREDKNAEDANTVEEVIAMAARQKKVKVQ